VSVAHGIRSIIAYLHVILNQGASERVYAYPAAVARDASSARRNCARCVSQCGLVR
jgi:hypothetical protein